MAEGHWRLSLTGETRRQSQRIGRLTGCLDIYGSEKGKNLLELDPRTSQAKSRKVDRRYGRSIADAITFI